MKWYNVFPEVPKEFHESVIKALKLQTNSSENNSDENERVSIMELNKSEKSFRPRNIYITLGAAAAAVMLMVFGIPFVLGNGILADPDSTEETIEPVDGIDDEIDADVNTNVANINPIADINDINDTINNDILKDINDIINNDISDVFTDLDGVFGSLDDIINNYNLEDITVNWADNYVNGFKSYTLDELRELVYDEAVPSVAEFSDVSSLTLNIISNDINIRHGGDKLTIEYDRWFDEHYIIKGVNGAVEFSHNQQIWQKLSNGYSSNTWLTAILREKGAAPRVIEITIPESMSLDSFIINTGSSKITIEDANLSLGNAAINYGSGDINLINSTIYGSAVFNYGSGNVNVHGSRITESATFNFGGGTTEIRDSDFSDSLSINSGSGQYDVINCTFGMLSISTAIGGGTVTLPAGAGNYDISFDTISGKLNHNGVSVDKNSLRNESAEIKINLSNVSGTFNINT
ncbi:MAG: DUF4097 domain-containing protein [Oscillospiraceae bacterium]|nr:DUF4097 domain-containing protein [Oscillospiraceae bacterium]